MTSKELLEITQASETLFTTESKECTCIIGRLDKAIQEANIAGESLEEICWALLLGIPEKETQLEKISGLARDKTLPKEILNQMTIFVEAIE